MYKINPAVNPPASQFQWERFPLLTDQSHPKAATIEAYDRYHVSGSIAASRSFLRPVNLLMTSDLLIVELLGSFVFGFAAPRMMLKIVDFMLDMAEYLTLSLCRHKVVPTRYKVQ